MSHLLDSVTGHKRKKKSTRRHSLTGTGLGATPAPTAVPVAGEVPLARGMQALSLDGRVVHEPERVIRHAPLVEKEILNEATLEVRREHHIQPVIHETERQVQPIIKTEVSTERPVMVKDTQVMEAPIEERASVPVGLGAVERVAPEGIVHVPKVERDVVVEHPVEVRSERHIQPIIHERERQIQPIIKTNITAEQALIEQDRHILHAPFIEPAPLPAGLEDVARVLPGSGVVEHRPKVVRDVEVEKRVQVNHEHVVKTVYVERIRRLQPVVRYEVVGTEERVIDEKDEVVVLPSTVEPPVVVGSTSSAAASSTTATAATTTTASMMGRKRITKPLPPLPVGAHRATRTTASDATLGTTTAGTRSRATMGQKLKGAVKQLQGSLTHNPAKKEEGKLIAEGVDPQRARTMASSSTGSTPL